MKKRENLSLFDISGLAICDSLHGRSWACWIGNLLQITNMTVRKPQSLTGLSYLHFCNVLCIWESLCHPYLQSLLTL